MRLALVLLAPDELESLLAGTPPIGDGGPFFDGGTDALDFFLSTPRRPYVPRPSRTSNTSHAPKQARRAQQGLNAAFNPLFKRLDRDRIGLAGHSYGASATSYLAQADPRVSAAVAWDAICVPRDSTKPELAAFGGSSTASILGIPLPTASAFPQECFGAPPGYAPDPPLRTPTLGLSGDYIAPAPLLTAPDRRFKAAVSKAFNAGGVDSGHIVIRGGNHLEWSWAPVPAGTLRGVDLSAWYTNAWFDRYLKRDRTAIRRLLTDRWHRDQATPSADKNLFSELYASRLDLHRRGGRRVICGDLRTCAKLRADPCAGAYGFLPVARGEVRPCPGPRRRAR